QRPLADDPRLPAHGEIDAEQPQIVVTLGAGSERLRADLGDTPVLNLPGLLTGLIDAGDVEAALGNAVPDPSGEKAQLGHDVVQAPRLSLPLTITELPGSPGGLAP